MEEVQADRRVFQALGEPREAVLWPWRAWGGVHGEMRCKDITIATMGGGTERRPTFSNKSGSVSSANSR
jgi:hypothetical protein